MKAQTQDLQELDPALASAWQEMLSVEAAMDAVEGRPGHSPRLDAALPGPGELRDAAGDLWIRPESEPAAYLWFAHLHDQWSRGLFGEPIAFPSNVALQFARELAAEDDTIRPLALAEHVRLIANAALPLLQDLHGEQVRVATRQNQGLSRGVR